MKYIKKTEITEAGGFSVGYALFSETLEVLGSAVLNGGKSEADAAFIMQVPHDYRTDDPVADAAAARDALGLPENSVGMMTAAEVPKVFGYRREEYRGTGAAAIATAGLSNHVTAGDVLDDYDEKAIVSARRGSALMAGTINVCVFSPVPLTDAGKVNLFIPLTEAKSAAMADFGFLETGTTSDAMAVFSPAGEGTDWAGTGSDLGIAAARAVRAAVGNALRIRKEHPVPLTPVRIMEKAGIPLSELYAECGSGISREAFETNLRGLFSVPEIAGFLDLAWTVSKRMDSLRIDGDAVQYGLLLGSFAEKLGVPAVAGDRFINDVFAEVALRAGKEAERCRETR